MSLPVAPSEPPQFRRGSLDHANCAECPLAKDGKPRDAVRGVGPDDPLWIALGEGPGGEEVKTGLPFVGPTGQLFNRALKETAVDRNRLWVTNMTACHPRGANEETRKKAAQCCRPRLVNELAEFPGRPILAMGGVAATTILDEVTDLPITKISGTYFEVDIDATGRRGIVPTVHPAAILRSSGDTGPEKTGTHTNDLAFWGLKFDVIKVNRLAKGEQGVKLTIDIRTELTDSARACALVNEILDLAVESKRLAIDYETTVEDPDRNVALQAWAARIKLIGLASRGKAVSVIWSLLDRATIRRYAVVLADETVTKEYHNASYDTAVSRNPHYRFLLKGPIEDTLLGQHASWPGAKKDLQSTACQMLAIAPWKAEFRDGDETIEQEAEYNAKDVLATWATVPVNHFWIKRYDMNRVYDVDRVKAHVAAEMHLRGYEVDYEVNAEIKTRLKTVIDEAKGMMGARYEELKERVHGRLAAEQAKADRKADRAAGLDYAKRMEVRLAELQKSIDKGKWTFDPSNDGHAVAFLKACGVKLWRTTATGKTASGGSVLEEFAHVPEVAELLLLRSNEQLYETFAVRMYEWVWDKNKRKWRPPHVQDDGRVHPIWSPTQISGRYGSKNPASSNWTLGDETNPDPRKRLPNVRRQLVAARGKIIVAFDYEQLEARLIAVQSGDAFLCNVFAQGLDIHHEFGVLVFPQMRRLKEEDAKGFKDNPEYNKRRDLTKRFEYGGIYGGADQTVWKAIVSEEPSITLKMTSEAIATMKAAIPGVLHWQQKLLRETSRPPYTLKSYLLGRRRVFPLGNPPPTDVNNNPNQFAGADIIDTGLCRMMPRLEKYRGTAYPILHQHDAMYFECNEADGLRVAKDIAEAFPTTVKAVNGQDIDFPVEVKMGYAYHPEPKPIMIEKFPELIWPVGRPGLKKVKV